MSIDEAVKAFEENKDSITGLIKILESRVSIAKRNIESARAEIQLYQAQIESSELELRQSLNLVEALKTLSK